MDESGFCEEYEIFKQEIESKYELCSICNIKLGQFLKRQDNLIGQFINTKQIHKQIAKATSYIDFYLYFIYFLKIFINFLKISFNYLKLCTNIFTNFFSISKLRLLYTSVFLSFYYLIKFEDPLMWLLHIWDFYLIFLSFCIIFSPFVFIIQFIKTKFNNIF